MLRHIHHSLLRYQYARYTGMGLHSMFSYKRFVKKNAINIPVYDLVNFFSYLIEVVIKVSISIESGKT